MIQGLPTTLPDKAPYGAAWLAVFLFTGVVAALVQFVVLGHIFPGWSNGHGLLLHTDSINYHRMAVALAARIGDEGWAVWELAPRGQFSAGFYAAVYALTVPEPWVAIPLNAAAHAFCGLILLRMAMLLVDDWRLAALAALPYVAFPSASMWYSQLLKDGYFNLGVLLFCYGWMRLARTATWRAGWWAPLPALIWVLLGYLIMGLVRPYSLTLTYWVAILVSGVLVLVLLLHARRGELKYRQALAAAAVAILCLMALAEGKKEVVHRGLVLEERVDVTARALRAEKYWRRSSWLPGVVDRRLAGLSGVRHAYLHSEKNARSMIDTDVEFTSAMDMFAYLPRAAQIGFLAPFPNQWLKPGSTEATTVMRRVAMLEMTMVYLVFLFLPFAFWRWRGRGELWAAATVCGVVMLVYALGTPNVGTLYRVRYAYLMVFVALGVLGAATLWRDRRARQRGAADRLIPGTAEQDRADV
jgi:hypothetical protein